ncbi:hypothetical protein AOC36_08035 [Erysipelothrix larvae]|uniref:NAD(P)-binding domain-containing protein n=1 Tax=Erysipelothrix larvae TaxID=1514105 RepID=A0A0X8H0S1_9FIRM|nr:NAD(P)H-binding protein [Erysipelothrix larvae]AMC93936.1 hypothetical protein AOC36_08035 [Erysipelothrix larvae]
MKLGIIGATGKLGTLLMDEALKRHLDVTAIIRNPKKLIQAAPYIEKDILALTHEDITQFDVVISAFGAPQNDPALFDDVTDHLIDIFTNASTRLIIVGGASSLYTDETLTIQLIDTPQIPDFLKVFASPMVNALDKYRNSDINWTFFSPSLKFDAKGPFSHNIRLGQDVVLTNTQGNSILTYPDAAQLLIDEALENKYHKKRFTAVSNLNT